MLPSNLTVESFTKYPPQARKMAIASLPIFRQLPLAFLPSLLRELIDYDLMFSAERASFDKELVVLGALAPDQIAEWFRAFSQIRLEVSHERFDWVGKPAQFLEQLSAYLWSTHQMDAFRDAATIYNDRIHAAVPPAPLPMNRLGIAVIGRGVASSNSVLFRKLRDHGTYFSKVNPDGGMDRLLDAVAARAKEHPAPYAHWYVDGGAAAHHSSLLTCVSYDNLAPARDFLLRDIQQQVQKAGMGPEELHSHLARLTPSELGMSGDPVLDRFQIKLLTEGSGTQIFSTTFAQWTAREVLRRAEAITLLVRFAPRQRDRPMNELLTSNVGTPETDPLGSLVDADMGAYYQWVNQQRLPEAEKSSFLVWFEGQNQALAVGPTLPHRVKSTSPLNLSELLALTAG